MINHDCPALSPDEQLLSLKSESERAAELTEFPDWSVRRKTGWVEKMFPAVTDPAWIEVIQDIIEPLAADTTILEAEQVDMEPLTMLEYLPQTLTTDCFHINSLSTIVGRPWKDSITRRIGWCCATRHCSGSSSWTSRISECWQSDRRWYCITKRVKSQYNRLWSKR
jgi:hypothetical protein